MPVLQATENPPPVQDASWARGPEDNTQVLRYVYMANSKEVGSYIILARILEDYEKCDLPGFGDVPGAVTLHLNYQLPGALR